MTHLVEWDIAMHGMYKSVLEMVYSLNYFQFEEIDGLSMSNSEEQVEVDKKQTKGR